MPAKLNHIRLSEEQRQYLQKITTSGKGSARKLNRARILIYADEAGSGVAKRDEQIAELLGVSMATVVRVRRRFVKEGLESALEEKPRPGQPLKLSGKQQAHVIALATSEPPEGRSRWTLRLIAGKLIELELVEGISPETVRGVLKKRPQAVAEEAMVHWGSNWGVSLEHGEHSRFI
jgi:transposase